VKVFGCRANVRPTVPHLKKLDDRSIAMIYLGVEEGTKAHRLFNPKTEKIVISRDVIFEEATAWEWNTEFGEGSGFREDVVDDTSLPFTGGIVGGNSQHGEPSESLGGAGETDGGAEVTGSVEQSVQHGADAHSGTVDGQATELEPVSVQGADNDHGDDQGNVDMNHDSNYDEPPLRFRNLNEVYEDSVEVEMTYDSEVEVLLTVMEEPSNYQDAAGDGNWVGDMESEIQSITKNKTWELVNLPTGHKPIGLKWVFKLKKNAYGEVVKHMARLVAKSYVQK